MKKQEAITILTASDYFWLRPSENEAEALNMAIEALQDMSDDFSSVEPPEDEVYLLNDKGAVVMNFETFERVLYGEITFSTIITRRKFERDKFEREEKAARTEKKTPISPPTLLCNDCTRYWYCAWDKDKEDCPHYK